MNIFKKGLSEGFLMALTELSAGESWWSDVLADEGLLIAIRDEYVNVYWQGQSIFMIEFDGRKVSASTHPKYLIDPELTKQVSFDVYNGRFGRLPETAILTAYEGRQTLKKMKTAAALFSGDEKKGVHKIVRRNSDVIDVEAAFAAKHLETKKDIPRMDIAALALRESHAELMFWEAKLFSNKELKAITPVVNQINEYRAVLEHYRSDVLESYKRVASNISAISKMSAGRRVAGPAIEAVAKGLPLLMSDPPNVSLVVFGFDADQRDGALDRALKKITASSPGANVVLARGDAKDIKFDRKQDR